jgi:hypothetical protein
LTPKNGDDDSVRPNDHACVVANRSEINKASFTEYIPLTTTPPLPRRRLRWLVFCLVMLVGSGGLMSWQEWQLQERERWKSSASHTRIRVTEYRVDGPGFLPQWFQNLFSRTKFLVRLDGPGKLEPLKALAADGPRIGQIILDFPADSEQVRWLRSEFPGVRLLERPAGKSWLIDVVR